jgi:tetratricopeptide (TPR) repeat protein
MRCVYLTVAIACCGIALAAEESQPDIAKRVADLSALAVQKGKAGDYQAAKSLLEQASKLCAPPSVSPPGLYGTVLASLADATEVLGDWKGATALLQQALAADRQVLGDSDPRTASIECRLGLVESALGDFGSAEPLLRRAVAVQRAAPRGNKLELALSLTALAMLDMSTNRLPEAEQNASEAVAMVENLNVRNGDYASILSTLGTIYAMQGRNSRALPLLNQSLEVIGETLSPENVRAAPVLVDRGMLEASEQKFALAEQDLRHAVAILDSASKSSPSNGDWARFRLGMLLMQEHKLEAADEVIAPAVERQRAFFGGPNMRLAYDVAELARLRGMQKRYEESAALYREAIAMAGSASPVKADAEPQPVREKDVRRLAQQASAMFGSWVK